MKRSQACVTNAKTNKNLLEKIEPTSTRKCLKEKQIRKITI